MEVLGGVVGSVAECVFDGFTRVHEEGCPVWNEVVEGGYNVYEGREMGVLG